MEVYVTSKSPSILNNYTNTSYADVHGNFTFPTSIHYIVAVIFLLVFIIGTAMNGMVVYVFVRRDLLHTNTNIYVMCLCICDLVMSVMATPLVVIAAFRKEWLFPERACTYYGFIVCIASYTQIHLLTFIAVDRYITIIKNHLKRFMTTIVAWWIVIGSLSHSLFWASAPLFGWSSYVLEGMGTSCSIDWQSKTANDISFSISLWIVMWLLPLCVITYCYLKVIVRIRKQASSNRYVVGGNRQSSAMKDETTKTMLLLIAVFVISWMPYSIVSIWAAIGDPASIHPVMATVPALSVKISVAFNPVVYLYRDGRYRKNFLAQFPFLMKIKSNKVMPRVILETDLQRENRTTTLNTCTSLSLEPRAPTTGSLVACNIEQLRGEPVFWSSLNADSIEIDIVPASDGILEVQPVSENMKNHI